MLRLDLDALVRVRPVRLPGIAAWIVSASLIGGLLSGCASTSKSSATAEPSAEAIEREERTEDANALKNEEAAETQKEREQLSVLEAKAREEAGEEVAQRTEAKAAAKAKRREQAAERAAKAREIASELSAKEREATARAHPSPKSSPKKKAAKPAPKESITAPPTVTVPSGSN